MYLIKWYKKVLKNHIKNMAWPEACMTEGYLKDKCIGFVIEYLYGFEAIQRCVWNEDEEYNDTKEVLQGIGKSYMLSSKLWNVAHQYVLMDVAILQDLYA